MKEEIEIIKKDAGRSITKNEVIERVKNLQIQTIEALSERTTVEYVKQLATALDKKIEDGDKAYQKLLEHHKKK